LIFLDKQVSKKVYVFSSLKNIGLDMM